MKTILMIRNVIIFILITCFSCSKDSVDDDSDSVPVDYGTMRAKVSGLTTIPNNTVIYFEPRAIKIIDNQIWITGDFKGNYTASMSIRMTSSNIEPGVYSENIGGHIFEGWSCNGSGIFESCWYKHLHNYHSSRGEVTITITQINEDRIVGTFKVVDASLSNQLNIVDGQFNILRE